METRHNVVMELIGKLLDEIDEIVVFVDEMFKTVHFFLRLSISGKGLSTTIAEKQQRTKGYIINIFGLEF